MPPTDRLPDVLAAAGDYAWLHRGALAEALIRHLELAGAALALAVAICVPAGIWIARRPGLAEPVIGLFNGLRVVPSLAVLFLALPVLGLGVRPAVVALALLAAPPVLLNTTAAFRGLDPSVLEAARGMGMRAGESLRRVEAPLALPVVLAGVRTAAVEVIASATLAAWIGGGGLGDFIVRGFALGRPAIMLVGAVPVALVALGAEVGLGAAERASVHWR